MSSSRRIILTLILILLIPGSFALSASTDSLSWEFNTPEGIQGWRGEGVEGSRVQDGIFQIIGMEQFRLISPPNLGISAKDDPYLRIRFLFRSPRYLRVFWQPRSGKPVLLPKVIQPLFDRNFHTSWIPLTNKLEYRDTIEQLGLIFGGRPGWVEIDSIEIRPFSLCAYLSDQWREFCLPRALHLGTINSLSSPSLFNRSFTSWLNKAALLVIILGAFLYLKTQKGRKRLSVLSGVGLSILIIWIIYDIRETYSQFQMVEEIHQFYIQPSPERKTFPALGNFYSFVEHSRKTLPPESQFHFYSEPAWPYDCRIKYFLYPRRLISDTIANVILGQDIPYHLVYHDRRVKYNPKIRSLVCQEGEKSFPVSATGRVISRFDQDSFVFKEDR